MAMLSILVASLLLTTPATQPDARGCYELLLGSYDDGSSLPTLPPPHYVELTGNLIEGDAHVPQRYEIRPVPSTQETHYHRAAWHIDDQSLHLLWSDGFTGIKALLTTDGESWAGEARSIYDDLTVTAPVSIELEPEECPAEDS